MKTKFDDFAVRMVLASDKLTERFEAWLRSLWARQRGYCDSADLFVMEMGLRIAFCLVLLLLVLALL